MGLQLISAELSDHSYQLYKLEAYVSVFKTECGDSCVMQYKPVGQKVYTLEGSMIETMNDKKTYRFFAFFKKHLGLASVGLVFNFYISSLYNSIKTKDYFLGGEHGNIILEGVSIKHHHLYIHHHTLTGSVYINSATPTKSVKFVLFNDTNRTVIEAVFKENVPYSDIEVWEYSYEKIYQLNGKYSFYVELQEDERQEKDDNYGSYYKVKIKD
ncbi:hypothetical protein [Bacillus sp. FJAT-45037]|uniref:hypothetical protein n=1 Tax=Bacillus sp. FJAT-45037 TaxID=2011007 RepID=UPI0012FD3720|nr:hypothetical protein [Bacillus sp. FJAT-45037]